MSAEPSGYNIIVSCSQDSAILFNCKAKKRPGLRLASKIDITTDRSRSAREYEPGGLVEITDGQLTVPDDPELEARILAIIGKKGVVTFRGRTSAREVRYTNAWFASYTPEEVSLDSAQPTAIITIQSAGGAASLPEVADSPEVAS
ncbi:MAG: hypothetical protein V8T90_12760 [Victivallales bacterium]